MSSETAEILRLLKSLHIFSRLGDEYLLGLMAASDVVTFKPGQSAARQGDDNSSFYILLEGQAAVIHTSGGEDRSLGILSAGDYFGVEESLHGRPSPVTITASQTLRLLRVPGPVFDAFLHAHPEIKGGLLVAHSTRRMLRHVSINWLRPAEVVYFLGRKHNFFLYRGLILPSILAIGGFSALAILYGAGVSSLLPFLGAGGIGGLALIWVGWNILDWSNDHFLVTSQRVVWLERIAGIYDSRQEAPLSTILSVGVKTGQVGRIFGFGDVIVRTYTGTITFQRIARPEHVAALVEEHWFRARNTNEKEEIQAMGEAIRQRLGRDLSSEEIAENTAALPVVEPVVEPGAVTRAFSSLFRMRFETGPVVTYRKHWFVLIRRTWKPFAWCLLAAILAGARLAGLISILSLQAFLTVDGIFFLAMFLWYVYEYLDWHNDIYQVTPEQIIDLEKKPFGREEKRAAPLENILSIEYERLGVMGLLFNFGTVTINVGIAQFTFDYVFNPLQVQKDLFNRLENRTAQKKLQERLAERERVSEWFATYDEITHPEQPRPEPGGDEDDGLENEPGDRQFWG